MELIIQSFKYEENNLTGLFWIKLEVNEEK